jgi:hypothetical protein
MEVPEYTSLEHNCYWLVTTVSDAIAVHWGLDSIDPTNSEDMQRQNRYPTDPDAPAPGTWNGMKITTSNAKEISEILSKYKIASRDKRSTVIIYSFQITVPY